MILDFMRNKIVEVEPLPDGSLNVFWKLRDSLMDIEVILKVKPPDLEIVEAEADLRRMPHQECSAALELIKKSTGIRVGAGLRKIADGLLGGPQGCKVLTQAVLESANAVILHFTRPNLKPNDYAGPDQKIEGSRAMVKANPRMAGSCVVFGENSPVMKGF
ncbi:MAG: DUF2889 domain-containing protein [Desulfatiglans sp.]|jgi:hypothetical protein|nr:DUF2889 domain-containing protein [Thermodesulfobacteriota bacterium]MEE4351753.1 DUF2889 domain-containing protein [Desulfatiglans sp.]